MYEDAKKAIDALAVLKSIPGCYLILLPDAPVFTIVEATDAYLAAACFERKEVIGKSLFQVYKDNPNNLRATAEKNLSDSLRLVLDQKTQHRMEDQRYEVYNPGTDLYESRVWRSLNKPVINQAGEVQYIIHSVEDITDNVQVKKDTNSTDRKLGENRTQQFEESKEELNNQKALVSSILNASLDGIYALKAVLDDTGAIIDFQYLFANDQIAKFLHLDVNAIIGSSMLQLLPENRTNGFFDLFCKLLQTGETFRDETHFVAQEIDRWFDYVIVPINNETLVVSTEDITEKKHSLKQIEEQRNLLDNILHNSSNGISVSRIFRDANATVIDALTILANDAAVKYIGLPKDIYLSKRATEIEPTIMRSPYYQACIKTLETGTPFVMQYHMESTNRWLELTVSRLDNDHLIQIFTDVTPIKEAQLQLERYIDELKRSNQNLEEFAYAASHDMKEPIRKVKFFADRLKQELNDSLNPKQHQWFERMERSADRMATLIDDLLTYSHLDKGVELAEMVDLNLKVKNVLEDLELEIEDKKASISVDPLPVIMARKRQMQQMFQNLISNALKYSKPETAPVIQIRYRKVESTDAMLPPIVQKSSAQYHLIEVADNGIGFEQENAERIFNVFTRLHGNAEYKGTGVGLSIVKKVVENHKGYIWAESKPGEGATFRVILPI